MKILLSPKGNTPDIEVIKQGHTLTINGEIFDFSQMSEGDTLPREAIFSSWFDGDVNVTGGEIVLTLVLPLPWNYSHEQAFPEPLLTVPDGLVALPLPRTVSEDEQAARDGALAMIEALKNAE
jgi:hypothetical protein